MAAGQFPVRQQTNQAASLDIGQALGMRQHGEAQTLKCRFPTYIEVFDAQTCLESHLTAHSRLTFENMVNAPVTSHRAECGKLLQIVRGLNAQPL